MRKLGVKCKGKTATQEKGMRDASNARNVVKEIDEQLHLVPSGSLESDRHLRNFD